MATAAPSGTAPAGPFAVNVPQCFVDIYPFEGGLYSIQGGAALGVQVEKNINGNTAGSFQITLVPGGPGGPNFGVSWSEVLTPMSLVVIGMRRGSKAAITMVGIILQVTDSDKFSSGDQVQRQITIRGQDFGYYFSLTTFMASWYLGATASPLEGSGGAGIASLGAGLASGTPDAMARAWYQTVMAGTGGVFSKTKVPFKGSTVLFNDALGTWFEPFSATTSSAFAAYLFTTDQTWAEKFKSLLPFPWYEFFVITAPTGFYPQAAGGFKFTCRALGNTISASPQIIARVNPTPTLTATPSNTNPQFTGIDCTRWDALPFFTMEGYQQRSQVVGFDESAVLNYFTLNPSYALSQIGITNSAVAPYIFSFAAVGDAASIERYGFRPANGTTNWLADPEGQVAQKVDPGDQSQFIADLMGRFCATYEPMALMARASVTTFLRPDIMPGCIFRYQAFKNGPLWDFYIEGVSHNYQFGQDASTTLTLTRGLPVSVYAAQATTGMLYNVHTGNAERLNGVYQPILPPGSDPALKAIPPGQQQQFFASLAKVYITPQATKTAGNA